MTLFVKLFNPMKSIIALSTSKDSLLLNSGLKILCSTFKLSFLISLILFILICLLLI